MCDVFRVAILFSIYILALCSPGDRSSTYQQCLIKCRKNLDCPLAVVDYEWTASPCFDCKQECMWTTVSTFKEFGFVPQFHGKWPFVAWYLPIIGVVQEPASVIFSIANFATVWMMQMRLKQFMHEHRKHDVSLPIWIGYTFVGMLTWIASALFHTRDFWVSEYADYFTAFAYVLYGFYASFRLTQRWTYTSNNGVVVSRLLAVVLVLFYIKHVYTMTLRFDYGYNMTCCIAVSVVTTILYGHHLVSRKRLRGLWSESDWSLVKMLLLANGAVALELFDFSPWLWTFDAHSLFHAATIPLPLLFADFLIAKSTEQELEGFSKLL